MESRTPRERECAGECSLRDKVHSRGSRWLSRDVQRLPAVAGSTARCSRSLSAGPSRRPAPAQLGALAECYRHDPLRRDPLKLTGMATGQLGKVAMDPVGLGILPPEGHQERVHGARVVE